MNNKSKIQEDGKYKNTCESWMFILIQAINQYGYDINSFKFVEVMFRYL